MELFAAVRAELQMVNALVKDNYIFSEIISSSHSENFNLNPNNTLPHFAEEFFYSISSSYTKETLQNSSHNTLLDPDSCYNQWLANLNLPLLPHPQTLYSFLKYIEQYNFLHLNVFNNALTIL